MDPVLNQILGVLLTLGLAAAFVFIWRRKPGQVRRARGDDELE